MKATVLLVVLWFPAHALSGELDERAEVQLSAARMFTESNFSALEDLATEYRTKQSRTPSGTWKLAEFYIGIAEKGLSFAKDEEADWERAFTAVDNWVAAYPESPTPYVVKGTAMLKRGWAYRGEGWAKDLKKDDVVRFERFAAKALEFAVQNKNVGSGDPHYYYLIADTYKALGASKSEYMALTKEALEKYPDYDPLYFKASGYLSPKWHGSLAELEEFAQAAVQLTKATRGYEMYARIYWASGFINRRMYAFQGPNTVWADMVKGMDAVIEKYPDQWNINHFGYFSCYKGDMATTRRYLKMVEEPVPATAWGGAEMNYQKCRLNTGLGASPNIPMPQ